MNCSECNENQKSSSSFFQLFWKQTKKKKQKFKTLKVKKKKQNKIKTEKKNKQIIKSESVNLKQRRTWSEKIAQVKKGE